MNHKGTFKVPCNAVNTRWHANIKDIVEKNLCVFLMKMSRKTKKRKGVNASSIQLPSTNGINQSQSMKTHINIVGCHSIRLSWLNPEMGSTSINPWRTPGFLPHRTETCTVTGLAADFFQENPENKEKWYIRPPPLALLPKPINDLSHFLAASMSIDLTPA